MTLDDLRRLFDGDDVSCIVLVFEDHDGIDVAPGIVGFDRPAMWRVIRAIQSALETELWGPG